MFKRKEPGAVTRLEGNPALAAWPVNSIFLGYTATSPAVLLGGGTWTRISQSRFLVGQGADTDFDTLGETGGEKNHTLTAAEMPSHTHGAGSYGTNYQWQGDNTHSGTGAVVTDIANQTTGAGTAAQAGLVGSSGSAGSSDPHNNLPPYLVVYIWRRTA